MTEKTERRISVVCQGCGWTVTLPNLPGDRISIEPVTGWEIDPTEHSVLCERCVTGWRPRD